MYGDMRYDLARVEIEGESICAFFAWWSEPEEHDYAISMMHIHNYYEVHLCRDTPVNVRVNGEMILVKPGQAIIIAPGTLHNATDPSVRELVFMYSCSKKSKSSVTGLAFREPYMIVDGVDYHLMEQIAREEANRQHGYRSVMQACFCILLITLSRQLAAPNAVWSMPTRTAEDLNFLIDAYFTLNHRWTLDKDHLANSLGVSKRQLERLVLSLYGMTFKEKVNKTRFMTARALLEQYRLKPTEVAEIVGYTNASSFFKAFKKYYGMTPMELMKAEQA